MSEWQKSTQYCPDCIDHGLFEKMERKLDREKGIWKYRHGCGYRQEVQA